MENKIKIKCPHCGYEYLPAEIFYPDSLLGKPEDISRDEKGKIIFYNGESMDLSEDFVCLNCGCTFKVDGTINFTTKELEQSDDDFEEEYSVRLDKK
jgi:DNA-directed RNA polymerase subunit RPC12/RpoP